MLSQPLRDDQFVFILPSTPLSGSKLCFCLGLVVYLNPEPTTGGEQIVSSEDTGSSMP